MLKNKSLTEFYLRYFNEFYSNDTIKKFFLFQTLIPKSDNDLNKQIFEKNMKSYLEEAELTLSLINNIKINKDNLLLEVGGGLGLVYGFLKKEGINIYGIEPSVSGFETHYKVAMEIFNILGIDKSNFYPFLSQDCERINKNFDVIFSNNVLEHIPELNQSFLSMKKVLKSNGIMIHNTVNYLIPYEPHFKIWLFPFFPKLTALFRTNLKSSSLWNNLNFITVSKLYKLCKTNNLYIEFHKDRLLKTLMRLDSDPGFANRQGHFKYIYNFLKLTKLIKFIDKIPISLTNPITFTIRNIND